MTRTKSGAIARSTLACTTLAWGLAQAADIKMAALADLSLEELGRIEVTSVSRRAESLNEAAASIYVITGESIRRSGASTLPEALRLAPNLQVARVNNSQYAISARGFNNAIGNKLLVLIDGRTVYAPFFSGVHWDQQDVMLDDVERIEVISGPGSTLWGANAVNGVINVITKSAGETQGGLVVLGGGKHEAGAALRYGGALGADGHFRVYAKSAKTQNSTTAAGADIRDTQERTQMGWRADWGSAVNGFTLQGDTYTQQTDDRGALGAFRLGRLQASGANVLARWTRRLDSGSDFRLQAYYDYTERDDTATYKPQERIFDIEFQYGLQQGAHRLLWGGGYRHDRDRIGSGVFVGFIPSKRTTQWKNVFVQDEIALSDRVDLTVGVKLETNVYTGTEALPSARLQWKFAEKQMVWGALSRAVRAPARLDRDIRLPTVPPFIIAGGPNFVSEVAKVAELGYRAQPSDALTYSVTAYRHAWDRLRSGQPPFNAQVQNMIEGATWGAEGWGEWRATQNFRLSGGFTLFRENLRLKPGSTDPDGPWQLGNDPRHQWMLRAAFNLSDRQELDVMVRKVAALPNPSVPAYTAVDLHYGWWLRPDVDLSVVGRNLFDRKHAEFGRGAGRSEFARSLMVRLRWSL